MTVVILLRSCLEVSFDVGYAFGYIARGSFFSSLCMLLNCFCNVGKNGQIKYYHQQ